MPHLTNIQQKIREAMVSACKDMHEFTGLASIEINAEYLLTVNVAKAIARLNSYYADPYQIFIEIGTKRFARDCLRPIVFGNPFVRESTIFRRGTPNIKRNGRIDVAVYVDKPNNSYIGAQPLCAIELKAFNPKRKLVLDDLRRNLEYFQISGLTGRSIIEFTMFAALHAFPKHKHRADHQIQRNEHDTKVKYEKWLSELGRTDDVHIDIDAFTISKELLGAVVDEDDHQVLDTNACHHFVGIIVLFLSKSNRGAGSF